MGMILEEKEFYEFATPYLEKIATELKSRYPDVPLMVFTRGACYANENLSKMGFDVVTMDGDVDRSTARATVGDRCGLQGNYDPAELTEDNRKTPETMKETAKALIDELGLIATSEKVLEEWKAPIWYKFSLTQFMSTAKQKIKSRHKYLTRIYKVV
ncbi:hypothetical protein CTEN210_08550 [Chaetoceros tenuissimus]|uniref:Uroporphyrinogen decarboxylase (URO-D) domain-containing protein n=1 Tax=Chaetoceros tenuissimus TaxID=426638 RepID=A0AAD3CUH1_9STRA|nr:hypothetical protein CTEN210_08549 [Chaetoceros tenuissimus]GFH52074.1 hypothetical protein CTEN210_08550 [Chaetoceros tenuissimus]